MFCYLVLSEWLKEVVVDSKVHCCYVGSAAAGTDASLSHLAMAGGSSWLSE
jgi:hypothetical protein